jgi:nucleotide-binding universal stress UspA family protein
MSNGAACRTAIIPPLTGLQVTPIWWLSVNPTASDPEPGNILLAHAGRQHSNLIVMGAYGHARWREWVLVGATRFLLQHTTLPALMSH